MSLRNKDIVDILIEDVAIWVRETLPFRRGDNKIWQWWNDIYAGDGLRWETDDELRDRLLRRHKA
jgi:hypothetical protein